MTSILLLLDETRWLGGQVPFGCILLLILYPELHGCPQKSSRAPETMRSMQSARGYIKCCLRKMMLMSSDELKAVYLGAHFCPIPHSRPLLCWHSLGRTTRVHEHVLETFLRIQLSTQLTSRLQSRPPTCAQIVLIFIIRISNKITFHYIFLHYSIYLRVHV